MAKKLRDSAYVNDLVLYRNACEEKKLRFTLGQLENLKSIYSRQKEQEKMFFAVQHMAVPVKTDAVIRNLRRGLHLDPGDDSRSKSAPVFPTSGNGSKDHPTASAGTRLMQGRGVGGRSAPVGGKKAPGTLAVPSEPLPDSNVGGKLLKNRVAISPEPNRRGKRRNPPKSSTLKTVEENNTITDAPVISPRDDDNPRDTDEGWHDDFVPDLPTPRVNPPRRVQHVHSWNKEFGPIRHKYDQPRLSDLPPVNINIYELPCSTSESKERWRRIMNENRNSAVQDVRSEIQQTRENQEIRRKWQSAYLDMKRDRITAMMKENLRVEDGQQLTLVKFLPKSRQSNFIKEAQQSQHKV